MNVLNSHNTWQVALFYIHLEAIGTLGYDAKRSLFTALRLSANCYSKEGLYYNYPLHFDGDRNSLYMIHGSWEKLI